MQRLLIITGLVLLAAGVFWPWLQKFNLGHLPGDVVIERQGFKIFFPVTTMIIISIVLSLLFWLFRK